MFVLCKDVKVYNFEAHYSYHNQDRKYTSTKRRRIQVLKNDFNSQNPFRTKGISMVQTNYQKEQNKTNNRKDISVRRNNSKDTVLKNNRRNNSNSRCMHSIELKDNRALLAFSTDHKKTTHIKSPLMRKACNQRENSPQNNIQLRQIKQSLLHKPTLSTTLQVTRKCSVTTSNTRNIVTPQRKNQIVQRSGFSIEQNKAQDLNNKSVSFGQFFAVQSRRSSQAKRSNINYNVNIFPAKKAQKNSQEQQQSDNVQCYLSKWEGTFRDRFHYDLKRVESNQKLESIDISNIIFNDTKDYIVEQSFIKQHQVRSNFKQIGAPFYDHKGFYQQIMVTEAHAGFLVSLKSYKQQCADQISKELRNYEQCGTHTNILSLFQHSFDKNQHILIKQPYNNLLINFPSHLDDKINLNSIITRGKQKTDEIANIIACMKNALQFLQAKGIWMTWIELQDIRQICGIYKFCNLQKSVSSVESYVSIQENLSNLENSLKLRWP